MVDIVVEEVDAGARDGVSLDLGAVLEEAGEVVQHREDHHKNDEVSGADVEPATVQ